MKYLPLVWKNLWRKKVRTFFTIASIFAAFAVYGALAAVKTAFGEGVELAGVDRLLMINKVSIIQPLPISYLQRIRSTEGVADVAYAVWFGGIYQDPKNFFAQQAVVPEDLLRLYPEFVVPEEQKQAWFRNRIGALVGRATADRFDWEIGDRIPLQGTFWRRPDGEPWEFVIEGIYEGAEKSTDETIFFFHYDYLDQSQGTGGIGLVGWYIIRIEDPERAPEVAERLDSQFANSPYETKTSTEKAFIQSFANQTGNIAAIATSIVSVAFFTMLLVVGNTMAQSVRERIGELAVLKTLGFTGRQVMGLVLAEGFLLALAGGLPGLLLVAWATRTFELGGTFFPAFYVPDGAVASGLALVLALGLIAGAVPALQALRLDIVEALRRARA